MGQNQTRRKFLQRAGAATAALLGHGLVGAAAWNDDPAGARASATLPSVALPEGKPTPAERPNILWVFADDCGLELGCYGDPLARTPNIDRIAAEGVRYTQAFSAAPVGSPSRSAFATGMMPTSIGAEHQHNDSRALPPRVRVLSHLLRDAGYFTACGWEAPPAGNSTAQGKIDYNFLDDQPFEGNHWSQRAEGQPFYMNITWGEPHRPFRRHPRHPIDATKVKLPSFYPNVAEAREDWAAYLDTIELFDEHVGALRTALEADGLWDDTILVILGDNGRPHVRDKQWLYDGGLRIPLIVRIPPRWTEPLGLRNWQPGSADERLISGIDLAPTMLALLSMWVPDWMEGQPFLGSSATQRECIVACRDRIDDTPDRIRAVRTRRFKYIRNFHPEWPALQYNYDKEVNYPMLALMRRLLAQGKLATEQARLFAPYRQPEELYDLQSDPEELHNLATDPTQQTTLLELRATLDEWLRLRGDTGATPEDPKFLAEARARAKQTWEARSAKKGLRAPEYM